jgi:hypothetical protein
MSRQFFLTLAIILFALYYFIGKILEKRFLNKKVGNFNLYLYRRISFIGLMMPKYYFGKELRLKAVLLHGFNFIVFIASAYSLIKYIIY